LIKQDIDRVRFIPAVSKFISKLLACLVLSQFKANLKVRQDYGVSWASSTFINTIDQSSCGSNLVITRDEFANTSHPDSDACRCAIGLFCLMECNSGRIIHPKDTNTPPLFCIQGTLFHLDTYNTKLLHNSLPFQTFDCFFWII
ncbi:hypothetical protein DFH28DRAFT_897517, partial [Melampsora americana]